MTSETTQRYVRVSEIAQMLGISVSTWWAWAAAGKTPAAIKLSPGVTVWEHAEILKFIQERKVPVARAANPVDSISMVAA